MRRIRWRNLIDKIHVAGEERGHPPRILGDELQRYIFEIRFLAPVPGVLLQGDRLARLPLDEFVGAGPDDALARIEVGSREPRRLF